MNQRFLWITLTLLVTLATEIFGQRSFIDAPSFYVITRDIENIDTDTGLGMDFGYGIGTHNLMAKVSGGLEVTSDLGAESITEEIKYSPFLKAEVGAGLWRTNNNSCSKQQAMAFTVMPKAGALYLFNTQEEGAYSDALNFYVGLELGLFKLRDYRRNGEFFIDGGYFMSDGPIFLRLGTRQFFNTKN